MLVNDDEGKRALLDRDEDFNVDEWSDKNVWFSSNIWCVSLFVFSSLVFGFLWHMQKRNEKKGESEKRYYEGKGHVSGD